VAGESRPAAPVEKPRSWRRVAGIAVFLAALLLVVLYVARTFVFARLVEIYLYTRGVPSSVTVGRLDWTGLDASLRLGARRTPDLAIGRLHAVFDGGWIPHVRSVTISHATLRVAFDGEKLSFGTLQRLVQSETATPRTPPATAPAAPSQPSLKIAIADAKLLAFTPAGVVSVAGSGMLSGSHIERFSGAIGRANLRNNGFALLLSGGSFSARSDRSGLVVYAHLSGHGLHTHRFSVGEADAMLNVHGLKWAAGRYSMVSGNAVFGADAIKGRALWISHAGAHFDLGQWASDGQTATGSGHGVIALTHIKTGNAGADKAVLDVRSEALHLTGGAEVSGRLRESTTLSHARYRIGTSVLSFPTVVSQAHGDVRLGNGFAGALTASFKTRLAIPSSQARKLVHRIALAGRDAKLAPALTAALAGATLEAAEMHIGKSSGPLQVRLAAPVTFQSRSGVRATLMQAGDFLFSLEPGGRLAGGFNAVLSGGGLPHATLKVARFTARHEAEGLVLDSSLSLSAKANLAALRDASIVAAGHLTSRRGRIAFVPEACAKLGLGGYVSDGTKTLSDLHVALCAPSHQPLLTVSDTGWNVGGAWRHFTATLDRAGARAVGGAGTFCLDGDGGGPTNGFVDAPNLRLSDRKAPERFAPLLGSARLDLANGEWRGSAAVAIAKTGRKLATVTFRHDMHTQAGDAAIVSDMTFAPDGFQPSELSGLLAAFTATKGAARFHGRFSWTADSLTSSGTLSLSDADVASPLGTVRQAAGTIRFASLVPLATASGQILRAQAVEWLVPFSDLVLRFELDDEALRLEDVRAAAAGGHVELAPMTVRLDSHATTSGTLELDNVNLGALVAASNLSGKVSLDAPVSGAIPFRYGPKGLRVTNGHFASTGPSRLSIKRTVWTGGAPEQQTDAIHDFAYQALENLAIDRLDATLNSLPAGRLGVIFHIKGRNDPAVARQTRISVFDLLQGHAFDKPLPLPKGTPVDLTLDTSLNFDELLNAYRNAFSAGRAGAAATPEDHQGVTP
jgi:hypothetical protein